ncbi:CRE-GLR-7 protein [Aphelenchoides avenae]|nr:CRE-GLR-7 protein [Aphelenchus avenae]
MSLNESMSLRERSRLAIWDYPVADKYTNMWRFMQESKLPNSIDEAIQRVLDSPDGKGFAFIGDAMEIKYAVLTNCKLQIVGTEFSRKPYAIAVQSGHPLKDKISQTVLKLLNQRSLEQLKEKWWHQNPNRQECSSLEDDSSGISIQNIGGVFIAILVGIVITLVILIVEVYCYYKKKKNAISSNEPVNGKAATAGTLGENHLHSLMITPADDDEPENVLRARQSPNNGVNSDEQPQPVGGNLHYLNSAFEF